MDDCGHGSRSVYDAPGLALFYGGLVRSKNVLSVLVQCFALAGVMTLLWVAYGYSLAFSNGGNFQKLSVGSTRSSSRELLLIASVVQFQNHFLLRFR